MFVAARSLDRRAALQTQLTNDFFFGLDCRRLVRIEERNCTERMAILQKWECGHRIETMLAGKLFPTHPNPGIVARDVPARRTTSFARGLDRRVGRVGGGGGVDGGGCRAGRGGGS